MEEQEIKNLSVTASVGSNTSHVILVSHGFQANYERGFVNGLVENRIDATLISSDRTDYSALLPGARTVNLRKSQQESRSRMAKLFNLLRYHLSLCAFVILNQRANVHVIGMLHPPVLCGVIEGLFFRFVATRYVLTVHDLLPHDRHTSRNRFIFGLSFRIPHRLIVHTRRMKERLVHEFGVSTERITVMEHGVESIRESTATPRPRGPGEPVRFLFFGLVAPYKGLDILLKAIEGVDGPCELQIMGRAASDEVRHLILSTVAAHGLTHRVTWRDEFIPEAEIAAIFTNADALVLPYRAIDQSGVLFQALRFGLPIIASRVGSFQDYVTPDIGLMFAPGDVLQLRECLSRFMGSVDTFSRPRIAEFGRTFEWSSTVRALDGVYARTRP